MERFLSSLFVFVFILGGTFSKDLHAKEKETLADRSLVVNLFNDNDVHTKHERYARHVEAVTETLISHLLQEINYRNPEKGAQSNSMKKMMKNLKLKLKKYVQKKKPQRVKKTRKNAASEIKYI